MALDSTGSNLLRTPTSHDLQESVLLCDGNPGSQQSYLGDELYSIPLLTIDEDRHNLEHLEEGECTSDNDQENERQAVEGDYSRPEHDTSGDKCNSAWNFLGHTYKPIQAVYADLIDELHRIAKPDPYTINEWHKKLRNPTKDDIEQIREYIHWTKSRKGMHVIDASFKASEDDTKTILNWYREIQTNKTYLEEIQFKIELEGRYSHEQDRIEILYWKRNHKRVFDDDEAAGEPKISERSRKIFDLDYFNARSSQREYEEVIKRAFTRDLDDLHEEWTKVLQRFCQGVQKPSIPGTTNDERSSSIVRSEPIKIHNDHQEPKCEVLEAGNPEKRRPFELWKAVEEAYQLEQQENICCARCIQCVDLRTTKGQIRIKSHHVAQVRVAILCDYETPDRYHRPYTTFTHAVQGLLHGEPTDASGISPYWRRQTFYKTLYNAAERRLQYEWPFDQLREAGVDYKLEPHTVTYTGYVDRDETKNCRVSTYTKQKVINNLPAPKHVQRHEARGVEEYDGEFTVFMTVNVDTIKARNQQILYADDRLSRRLKQIMTDTRAEGNDLYCIGAILLAISALKQDRQEDEERPKKPPYGKAPLKGAMDQKTWEDYNNILDACRKKQKIKEIEEMIGEARKSTSNQLISSTHGHPEVIPILDADHSGPRKTGNKFTKDTKWTRPPTPYRATHYSSGQLKKGKSSSGSIPTSIPQMPMKDRTDKDKHQRDGGNGSSVSQRKSVFERLTMTNQQKQQQQQKDLMQKKNNKNKEKDKEVGNAKKIRK